MALQSLRRRRVLWLQEAAPSSPGLLITTMATCQLIHLPHLDMFNQKGSIRNLLSPDVYSKTSFDPRCWWQIVGAYFAGIEEGTEFRDTEYRCTIAP